MPAPDDLQAKALTEARRERSTSFNPFRRNELGRAYDREAYLFAVLRCMAGDTYDFFEPLPGETIDDAKKGEGRSRPGRVEVNNARYWLQTLANTYQKPPRRTFFVDDEPVEPKDDPALAALVDYYEQTEIDRLLEEVDFWLYATGNVVLRPIFDDDNKELVVHMYRGPQIRVVENKLNPRRPWATIVSGVERRTSAELMPVTLETTSEIFLPGKFITLTDNALPVEQKLDKPIPLVHCFNILPTNLSRYFSPSIGPALTHIDRIFNNDLLGPLGFEVVMQGFAQAVAHGVDKTSEIAIGPGRIIKFSGDPGIMQDFKFVSPDAPLSEVVETLDAMLGMIRRAHGIPDSLLEVKTDSTGAAIVQANAPLAEQRERRGKAFYGVENDLARASLAVLAGRDDRVPAAIDVSRYKVAADYSAPATSMSVADKNTRQKFLIDIGVLTPGDIAVEEFPQKYDGADEADVEIAKRNEARRAEEENRMRLEAQLKGPQAPPGRNPKEGLDRPMVGEEQ